MRTESASFTLISDFHNQMPPPEMMPPADILIVAGDMTQHGTYREAEDVLRWMAELPYRLIVTVGGNHDRWLEKARKKEQFQKNAHKFLGERHKFLEHEALEWEGIKFFGSPYVPVFCHMGFNRSDHDRKALWERIPDDTQVLITHVPPLGILDSIQPLVSMFGEVEATGHGCQFLRERIRFLPFLKLHAFGHIHECGGESLTQDGKVFANSCLLNPRKGGYAPLQIFRVDFRCPS